ncbi:MAG: extracellular solute-binding protein [Opitutaceae bacterium]
MPERRDRFRIAIRDFGPFEAAIREGWRAYCEATGCPLGLEVVAFDLRGLHEAALAAEGLKRGEWDAALLVTDWLAEAGEGRALADLGARLRAEPGSDYPDAWTDSLLRHQRFGDAVLGLPFHDGPECLVYRTDLLDAAGARVPDTWEEFRALARMLSAPEERRWGTVFAAYPDGHNTVYDFCLQLWSRGGDFFDASGKIRLDTPAAEEALAFYRGLLRDAGAIHPECRRLDSIESGRAFARGEAAMMVNWFGFAVMAETLPESRVRGRVSVAPVPATPGFARTALNVYWILGAGAGSPHPAEAYEFIRTCTGTAGDKGLTLGGGVGCRRSTWRDPEVCRRLPFYPELETLHKGARELPRHPAWEQLSRVIDRLVTRAINTAETESRLLADAQREAGRIGSISPAPSLPSPR